MFEKVLTNGVAVSYGPSFPTTQVADGTLFYKTTTSTDFPVGFYVYGTRPDTNASVLGPQVGQGWFSADPGDLYLKLTGGTLTGALGLTNYLRISATTAEQRILIGNTSVTSPVIIASQNKILKIGLGQSFSSNGGALTSILTADFTNLTNGLTWDSKKVWHEGNDGANSGLDADLLDGFHASDLGTVPNSIVVRTPDSDIAVNRVNFLSTDDDVVGQFITTNGTDGFSKKASVSKVREAIRVDSATDGVNRKLWNINISGNAGSASEVNWNNISNKPSWLVNGNVDWDDVAGKPTTVYKYGPELMWTRTKNAEEYTADGRDVHSGIFAYGMVDMPGPDNSFRDPGGVDAFAIYQRGFWAGFQTITNGDNGWAGIQLMGRWDAENHDHNGDGLTFEDSESAVLAFRVNDDYSGNKNDNSSLNKFSPWIKIWTNTSLTSLGQLNNDVGYAKTDDLSGYLKKNSPVEQELTGALIAFRNQVYGKNSQGNVSYLLDAATGRIESSGTITAVSHLQTTNGDHYTENGRVWSDRGHVGAGSWGGNGAIKLAAGDSVHSGQLIFSSADQSTLFARIIAGLNSGILHYQINPFNQFSVPADAHHRFDQTIKSVGDVVAYASDVRLKTNVKTIENAVSKVIKLGGYTYDWKLDKCLEVGFKPSNKHEHGLIAQEVQEIIPDAVTESAIDGYLTVKYERIVPVLTAAVAEQAQTIEQLQNEVAELKSMLKKMIG